MRASSRCPPRSPCTGTCWAPPAGVEAIVSVKAILDQFFPPTRNLEEADPECDLDYVPHKGYEGRIRAAISNALGFGGHNSVVLFQEYKG